MYFMKILIWFSQQPDEVYITIHILEIKISVAQRAYITCLASHVMSWKNTKVLTLKAMHQ